MTVVELIEVLAQFDEDMEVLDGSYLPIDGAKMRTDIDRGEVVVLQ